MALVSDDPEAQYLAGGTTQLDLMLRDGVLDPDRLIDITRLPLRGISRTNPSPQKSSPHGRDSFFRAGQGRSTAAIGTVEEG